MRCHVLAALVVSSAIASPRHVAISGQGHAVAMVESPRFAHVAAGEGGVWLMDRKERAVVRLDPATVAQVARIPLENVPIALTVGEGAAWILLKDGTLVRIDPASNQVATRIALGKLDGFYRLDPDWCVKIAAGEGALWVYQGRRKELLRVDPARNRVVATIPVAEGWPAHLAIGEGAVFAIGWERTRKVMGHVVRVDPATNAVVRTTPLWRLTPIVVGPQSFTPALAHGSLWFGVDNTRKHLGEVVRLDLETDAMVARIPTNLQATVNHLVAGAGSVFTSQMDFIWKESSIFVGRIDPATNELVESVEFKYPWWSLGMPEQPKRLAFGEGALWVAGKDHLWKFDVAKGLIAEAAPTP